MSQTSRVTLVKKRCGQARNCDVSVRATRVGALWRESAVSAENTADAHRAGSSEVAAATSEPTATALSSSVEDGSVLLRAMSTVS